MNPLQRQFEQTRKRTEAICEPLEPEDYVVQPMSNVSPPKWHLAHTTWFFEQFVLLKFAPAYKEYHPDFAFLFNSYYNNLGERTRRDERGFMTRPGVKKVMAYREHVTQAVLQLLAQQDTPELLKLIETGIHHEQQHQELLVYDLKYILGTQPTFPALGHVFEPKTETHPHQWLSFKEGVYPIGNTGTPFCFDNEMPQHKQYLQAFEISNKLVTNADYLEFMEDGGYENFNLWHDEGLHFIKDHQIKCPLYWHFKDGTWHQYTFNGLTKIDMEAPLMHLSMYEAFAFAEWKGMRLPTEFEWEVAADHLQWGQLWEWTHSAYLPYPGFTKAPGALGEYNGKFMMNQMVLRGASTATSEGHERSTYRNFFHASSRWIFSGVRLVKK